MQDYSGAGVTNNVLQITVTGDSDAEAVARAGALADAFVADHVRRIQEASKAEANALRRPARPAEGQLAQVNKTIGDGTRGERPGIVGETWSPSSPAGPNSPRGSPTSSQRAARGASARPTARRRHADRGRPVRGAVVPAQGPPPPTPRSGCSSALFLGLALAAVGVVVADRPVLRRDIAANLGASVIAELPHRSGGRWRRRRIRASRERLTTSLARTVRGSAEPVSLLELGCARNTSVIALDLARALAAEGPWSSSTVSPARSSPTAARSRETPPWSAASVPRPCRRRSRRIGVGSVAPGTAWTDLQYLGTQTVLVVRAGHGSAAWLHTVARQLADQRIPVIGVVLIDPDPRDRTDGTLWDGLHTALRGRSERPARQNGTGPRRAERQPMWAGTGPGQRPGGAVGHVWHRRYLPMAGRKGRDRPAHRHPRPPRSGRGRPLRPRRR